MPYDHGSLSASEMAQRASLPVFVNSFEQMSYLRDTLRWFACNGFRDVTVIEQGSTYGPLIDWYASSDFSGMARLWWLGKNVGPRRAVRKAASRLGAGRPFIFTDPDLDLPDPPDPEFLTRMFALGAAHGVAKVGLALDLSDPDKINLCHPIGRGHTIASYFSRFYEHPLEPHVWRANTDTTFFLHVPQPHLPDFGILQSQPRIPGLRIGGAGFVAGHRPWYFDNGMSTEEEAHYRRRTTIASTFFSPDR
jgi:hypothetical protein